jgi:hypothetical protein
LSIGLCIASLNILHYYHHSSETSLFSLQVQEFEHINGYYSMPEMIRKPVEPIKVGGGTVPPGSEQGGEMPRSATTSTSATPATSAAASPAPTLNSQDESKDKEVRTMPCLAFVNDTLLCLLWLLVKDKALTLHPAFEPWASCLDTVPHPDSFT